MTIYQLLAYTMRRQINSVCYNAVCECMILTRCNHVAIQAHTYSEPLQELRQVTRATVTLELSLEQRPRYNCCCLTAC